MKKYITHAYDLPIYHPPGHSKTENRRLLGPGAFGSNRMEVVLGEIEAEGQADAHSHESLEQAFFVIRGRAEVEIDGKSAVVGPDDFIYLPTGATHRVTPLEGERLKLLIIYTPPLVQHNR